MPSPPLFHDSGPALSAYEPLAAYYDDLTTGYAHDRWVEAIERELANRGLGGPRVLDVACGTGKSALPWIERGYDVTACDLSPAMVARARSRLGLSADRVFVADARTLDVAGGYDVITCLDDSLNYILDDAGRAAALARMGAALRPGGALVFDCNTLSLYRERFVGQWESVTAGLRFRWSGTAVGEARSGGRYDAVLDVFSARTGDDTPLASSTHRQRHHPEAAIRADLAAAGLALRARLGQASGIQISPVADEERHPKVLHLAQRMGPDLGRRQTWSSTPDA